MRLQSLVAVSCAIVVAACGGSPGASASTSPAPSADPNPCASGACKVTVEMDETVAPQLSAKGAMYHVYEGCPKKMGGANLGNTTASSALASSFGTSSASGSGAPGSSGTSSFGASGTQGTTPTIQTGLTDSASMRSATPLMAPSPVPVILIPSTMKGRIATVVMWWGAQPHRYVVVDFAKGATQVINYGYRWDGNKFYDDPSAIFANVKTERGLCK